MAAMVVAATVAVVANSCVVPGHFEARDETARLPLQLDFESAVPPFTAPIRLLSRDAVQPLSFTVRADPRFTVQARWFIDYDRQNIATQTENLFPAVTDGGVPDGGDGGTTTGQVTHSVSYPNFKPCSVVTDPAGSHLVVVRVSDGGFVGPEDPTVPINITPNPPPVQSVTAMWVVECQM